MDQRYNLYNLEASFRKWLLAGIEKKQNNANSEEYQSQSIRRGLTKISIKNYLSDLRHFFGWLIFYWKSHFDDSLSPDLANQNLIEILKQVQDDIIENYKSYLVVNQIPIKTINRRLSTLRKFFTFCISQGWIEENPAKKIKNEKIKNKNDNEKINKELMLNLFQHDLQKENFNQKTIKSYLEVVQEFLSL